MVTVYCPYPEFVIQDMWFLPFHLTLALIYLFSGIVDVIGICDAWVTGVDFAIGVAIVVISGRVFS